MKKTLLLLTAGIIVGAGASQFLRAAEGPPVYSVAEINVRDKVAYEKALPEAMNFIKEGGGKYLAGAAASTRPRQEWELLAETDLSCRLIAQKGSIDDVCVA